MFQKKKHNTLHPSKERKVEKTKDLSESSDKVRSVALRGGLPLLIVLLDLSIGERTEAIHFR